MKFRRLLNLKDNLAEGSLFLFGARGTGKSYLIRETLKDAFVVDLLKTSVYSRLSENPGLLEEMIQESPLVVIDEVQKLPILLDEVHRLIEEKGIRFLLTGSSARKLKRGHANLLAGRAAISELRPLTSQELPKFRLSKYLLQGGLPKVWLLKNAERFLDSYIEVYLKEEVLAEQAARSLPHFSRFLRTAALCSGELLNFAGVASDSQISESTVKNYFEVLQDTLLGTLLEPWLESKKRKAIATGKFYLFDIGVRNRILDLNVIPESTDAFGKAFEHFIFMELKAFQAYYPKKLAFNFWRSVNGHEVDFLLGKRLAIEVKATTRASDRNAKNLLVLREEKIYDRLILASQDPINREKNGVLFLHWKEFLDQLWQQLNSKKRPWF